MDSTQKYKQNETGIALFMVLSAVAVLAVLVSEFTYISQISQSIAFSSLDQLKAHYTAKSGLKIALLRLKAYQQAKAIKKSLPPTIGGVIEKIWSFPFQYPIPTNIPGLGAIQKDAIQKFQDESNLEGSFSILIESESSKYNLNSILPNMMERLSTSTASYPMPSPTTSPTTSPTSSDEAQEARNGLHDYLEAILSAEFQTNKNFAENYRELRLNELIDAIAAWSDARYEQRISQSREGIPMKRAPLYSFSELHMVPSLSDDLFELLSKSLNLRFSNELNINTINSKTLTGILPKINKNETETFFKYRDSPDADQSFQSIDDFYKYLQKTVSGYKSDQDIKDLKDLLNKRHIQLITEEIYFKITVQAKMNRSIRIFEVWVSLSDPQKTDPNNNGKNTGLKINDMRIR